MEARTGPGIEEGTRLTIALRAGPFRMRWVAEHGPVVPGRRFEDRQLSGPFARWRHEHRFEPRGVAGCVLEDRITYALLGGALGALAGGRVARARIARMFRYRHAVTQADLGRHASWPGPRPLVVAVTGATGLVGSALCAFLTGGGHTVRRIVRRAAAAGDVVWDTAAGRLDPRALQGVDAIVHLAGEGIASGRWTADRKRRILESRTQRTRLLAEAAAALDRPPSVFVSASAIGYYGNASAPALDERAPRGAGFLADVVEAWERAAEPASRAGIRTAHLRFGVVLSARGGALAKMLPAFKLGAGGPIGGGRQGMSWVSLDDTIGAIHFALGRADLSGPLNVVAPGSLPQRDFARTLGAVLGRPAFAPLPGAAISLLFGEMGREALLAGSFVEPRALLAAGFRFQHADLEGALRHELGRLEGGPDIAFG